jgi:hypothetical protein
MQRACLKSGGFVTSAFHTFHAWLGGEGDARARAPEGRG